MADFLRTCPAPLALALQGNVKLYSTDLYVFTLADGVTTYRWTTWETDLVVAGHNYSSKDQWLKGGDWSVTNDMTVPTMQVDLYALDDAFGGGANIKTQIHNGLFDGATCLMSQLFMETPGDTASLGAIDLFGGVTGAIDIIGSGATITVKGKNNLLDQNAPRNTYQIPCQHGFCDVGCTLNRATYTTSYAVGASPSTYFLPWPGAAPANYAKYRSGWLAMTSGAASGSRRSITAADATGLTLAYPLWNLPAPGDTFSATEGCTKMQNDGSGQDCTARGNTQNYRGFRWVPPPSAGY